MAAYFSLLCMLLFLGVCRTVPCSTQLEKFVGLSHIAGIGLCPELQPCAGAVQVELTRRQSYIGLPTLPELSPALETPCGLSYGCYLWHVMSSDALAQTISIPVVFVASQ